MPSRIRLVLAMLALASAAHAQTPTPTTGSDTAPPDSSTRSQSPPLGATVPTAAPTFAGAPTAPDFPRGRISGLVFGDYYYNAVGDPHHGYNAAGADSGKAYIDNTTKPIAKDLNGVQIRRIYFQLDNDLTVRVSTRFRLEADSKSLTSDGKLGVAVKAGYVQVRNVYPRGDVFVGIMGTPSFEFVEEFWGYRSIEKVLGDFRGVEPSTDIGLGLKGYFDANHVFGYYGMVGNGTGQAPENNRDKRSYLALPVRAGEFKFEPYVDYENVPNHSDRATYHLFAGYEQRLVAIGAEALQRVNHTPAGPYTEPRGLMLFARSAPWPTFGAFARVDFWRPDQRSPNRIDSQLWIAGLDWQPVKDLHFMPNIEATQYLAKGTAVAPANHDLQARITVYYRFTKPQS